MPEAGAEMRILLAGALSWNPERIRSLYERGHQLWGLWSRSMAWDQAPYPGIEDCIREVTLADAASTIREQRIGCVLSLFQVYEPKLWGPPAAGVEDDVWTLLRALLIERDRGGFDVPIVRHWGFDVHVVDTDVVGALDGHIFCNREQLESVSAPIAAGGYGLELDRSGEPLAFLDSDRPKLEFMNDRFGPPLSERDGEIHTVCVGRPINIDFLAAARQRIHVHVYGNGVDDTYPMIAKVLSPRQVRRAGQLLDRYLHVHEPLQNQAESWSELRRTKARWVEEFSRYDAGWSYIGQPLRWTPLQDRAAIPNRIGTYLLSGLPVITDRRPGAFRYEELRRLGVELVLAGSDYGALRGQLVHEVNTREKRAIARARRFEYSFDATIDPLLGALEGVRASYFSSPAAERTRFRDRGRRAVLRLHPRPRPRGLSDWRSRRAGRLLQARAGGAGGGQ